jgi:hypothetical protein
MTTPRFLSWLISDATPDIAACESDCRNTRCTDEHWKTCELRLAIEKAITAKTTTVVGDTVN